MFIYKDSEDRIIATTETPNAMVGDFALMRTVATDSVGTFLDWGLMKDLLVPFREQKMRMEVGRWYIVYVYLDSETQRLAASAKIEKFLDNVMPEYSINEEVNMMIYSETDLGFKVIVNQLHLGMLYHNEIFERLDVGQQLTGFIKKVREDEKIDLTLQKPGYEQIDSISHDIFVAIKRSQNFIELTDKSSPEEIYNTFGISKKNFKKAIGNLYRNRLITIEKDGIRVNE